MTVPWNPLMIIHCRRGLRWVYVRIFMDSSENGMSAYLCPFEEMTWIVHNRKEETDTVRIRLADFSGLHCVKRELKNVWNDANRLILFFRRNQMTCNQCVGNSISLLVQQWVIDKDFAFHFYIDSKSVSARALRHPFNWERKWSPNIDCDDVRTWMPLFKQMIWQSTKEYIIGSHAVVCTFCVWTFR